MFITDISTPVVILRSDSHGGLNIMRSLGRLGVQVFNMDPDRHAPAFYSRYCAGKFFQDIEHSPSQSSVDQLLRVRKQIGRTAILIPTSDRTARFVAQNRQDLEGSFIFPRQDPRLVCALSSKREMFHLAGKVGIPTPTASFPQTREDVLKFLARARFPIMLKGIDGQKLYDRTGKKMFIIRTKAELLAEYDAAEDPSCPNLMLQEYIPGGEDTVWMFNGYFDVHSVCLVGFTGKKIRQCPIYTGSTSLGICAANTEVEDLTRKFMKSIGYRGIIDIGYRYDARDGQYKVLDVNPRIGATFRLFVGESGMDVARALYLDLTGQPVVASKAREGRKWIVEDHDLVSSIRYACDGHLTLREWISSLRRIDEGAFLAGDDLLPVFAMAAGRSRELLQRILRWTRSKLRERARSSTSYAPASRSLNESNRLQSIHSTRSLRSSSD